MTSTTSVFAWVGVFLVNVGFVALTSWGTSQQWIFGVVLCLIYMGVLFGAAKFFAKRIESDPDNEVNESFTVILNLLYILAVLALGVSGLIVSLNVFDCDFGSNGNSGGGSSYNEWIVPNLASLPSNVQTWYSEGSYKPNNRNFVHLESVDVLLYGGTNETDGRSQLWRKTDGEVPYALPNMYQPRFFVSGKDDLSQETTCLLIETTASNDRSKSKIVCTNDGVDFRYVDNDNDDDDDEIESEYLCCLFWDNKTVWFTGNDIDTYTYSNHELLYSMNPVTMETTLYSIYNSAPIDGGGSGEVCDSESKTALATLFLSALPVFVVSLILLKSTSVPSLPLTAYAGFTSAVFTSYVYLFPENNDGLDDVMKWWLFASSTVWFISIFLLFVVNRVGKGTLNWSLNFSAIIFLSSWLFVTQVPFTDIWWRWILVNIFVLVPLILIGTITNRIFVTFLGACVFVLDAFKVGTEINSVLGSGLEVPVFFVVFAVSGGLVIAMGWLLNKYQNDIEQKATSLLSSFLGCLRPNYAPIS